VPLIGYRVTHRNSRRTASAPPEPEQIPPLVAIEKNVAGTFALSHRFCDSASLSRRRAKILKILTFFAIDVSLEFHDLRQWDFS